MFQSEFSRINTQNQGEINTLEREIKFARNIQMKLLNGIQPAIENGEISGVSFPARLVGGDYFDFYLLPNGNLRIVIGDVMGKGIPAAMLMILTRGAFRTAAESTNGPGETLQAMNNAMYSDLRTLGSFVTFFCAEWDPKQFTLTFANAGHNLPLIVRSETDVREVPKIKGVMLGGLPNQRYSEESVKLTNDDIVLFYTDGIVEAKNKKGEMYRSERLHNVLLESYTQGVKEIEDSVVQSIDTFTEGVPQKDDITLVLLKINQNKLTLKA